MNDGLPTRPLIAGNWKMNGLRASVAEVDALLAALRGEPARADVALCPPATLLLGFGEVLRGSPVLLGAQDCHAGASGAHTGDLSARMLADAGAALVILGHSERRTAHGERDSDIRAKAQGALAAGLAPIICVGETAGERRLGRALDVVARQLAGAVPDEAAGSSAVIAYEPVWAIGTGLVPRLDDIAEVHGLIRAALGQRFGAAGTAMRILYGGSVKPDNAADILALEDVGGALVGGASLKADDFLAIIRAA